VWSQELFQLFRCFQWAVIFAIEVILMEISTASISSLLIAFCKLGSLTRWFLIGQDPVFTSISWVISGPQKGGPPPKKKNIFFLGGPYFYLLLGIWLRSSIPSISVVLSELPKRLMEGLDSQLLKLLYGERLSGFMVFFFPADLREGMIFWTLLIMATQISCSKKSIFSPPQ